MPSLPTAYISLQGARVRLDGGTLLIEHPEHATSSLPLGHVGGLVLLGSVELTTAAMSTLAERGIACVLASRSARVRAIVAPWTARGHARRAAQHHIEACRAAGDRTGPHLSLARAIIDAKCGSILELLAQHQRTHTDVDLGQPIAYIRAQRERASHADTMDELRGHEGAATASYFSTMPALCRGELTTAKRTRQPPRDPINAALSFGYSLLVCEMTAALLARGLDPALGLLHPPAEGRPSLALDLIEPFRHKIIDRLVLRAANRRELTAADFASDPCTPDGESPRGGQGEAVVLTDAGRRKFLRLYQSAMTQADATHESCWDESHQSGRTQISSAVQAFEFMLDPPPSEFGTAP